MAKSSPFFDANFGVPRKHKLHPSITVTLSHPCVAWAGWFGQEKKTRQLNIYQSVNCNTPKTQKIEGKQ